MNNILEYIRQENYVIRIMFFMLGMFIAAFTYNLFFVPNNIIVGGVSGLAIIAKNIFGISTTFFIDICDFILVIFGLIFLGVKETFTKMLGFIIFPIMVTFTANITSMITLNIDSTGLKITMAALIYGIGNGIISRAGFSAFGTDIAIDIISKKRMQPTTKVGTILNSCIVMIGSIIFTPVSILYSIYVITIVNLVTNNILFGTSSMKMIYVISDKRDKIEEYIDKTNKISSTNIKLKSGAFIQKNQMLLCIVHNSNYTNFKRNVLDIDNDAFFLTSECFELSSQKNYGVLPF